MIDLNSILYRDEAFAKREASRGMCHTFYLFAIIKKLAGNVGLTWKNMEYDAVSSGRHSCVIVDPITGLEYELSLLPLNQRKKG